MHDAFGVRFGERSCELDPDIDHLLDRQRTGGYERPQRGARNVLAGEVQLALNLLESVDRRNAGMGQGGRHFRFVEQPLTHIGMGDFEAKLPGGTVTFTRHSDDVLLPQQTGRLHRISHSGGTEALTALLHRLVEAQRIEHVGTWPTWPVGEATPPPLATEKPVAHLYQIEGETYADEPILQRLVVEPLEVRD